MRPHRLLIEAFGPYADSVTIEFDELARDGLFLIHGPTGSGKTFLLDAMTFALYGEVAGARGRQSLRSDHAEPRATPRVTLEFSAQGHRYIVERSPTHAMVKVRGEGHTTKPATAVLSRIDSTRPVPIASSITEVTQEVTDLVGLDVNQFQQVILLPQGQFEQVLRAGSGDREQLLKTLFDSEIYERVTWWLDEKATKERRAVYEQQETLDAQRKQAAHEWRPFAHEADSDIGREPTDPGEVDGTPLPTDQAALDVLVARIGEVVDGERAEVDRLATRKRETQRDKESADATAARWDRRADARTRAAELAGRAEEIATTRKVAERAERAERLRTSLETEKDRRAELDETREKLTGGLLGARAARDVGTALPGAVTGLDLTEIPPPAVLTAALSALASYRTRLDGLVKNDVDAKAETATAKHARSAERKEAGLVAKTTEEARDQSQARAGATELLDVARTARDQLPGLTQAAATARHRAEAATALEAKRSQLTEAKKKSLEQGKAALEARKAAQDVRRRHLDGIAATLAGALADDRPCPVCGSTDHPEPAVAGADAVAGDEVEAVEGRADRADERTQKADATVGELATKVATLEATAGAVADDPAAARFAAAAAKDDLSAAEGLARTIESLEARVAGLDARLAGLDQAIADATLKAAAEGETATAAEHRAAELAGVIVAVLGDDVAPLAALEPVTDLIGSLEVLARDAGKEATRRAAHEGAIEHLERELESSPFADASEANGALRDEGVRTELATKLGQHDREVIKQQSLLDAPDLADLLDDRPDTVAASKTVERADLDHTTAVESHKSAADAQVELVRLATEHRTGEGELAELARRAQIATGVADRCAGRLAPKVSLQRWVLAAYLEDICSYANTRFEAMTAGRYRMLVHRESESGNTKAGLGIRVLDAFTGEEREVSTLSGGETFQASLALALGVADAVQAHAGGVHLDTLFIDEGFGTLDPDNLQLAMDELDRLREGGRMVGVISHVGALRERIRSGIEVIPTDKGSTVRVGDIAPV